MEAQELANEHNQRLRLKLGLPPEVPGAGESGHRRIHRPVSSFASRDEYKSLTLSYSF